MLQNFQGTEPNATFKIKCEQYVDGQRPKNYFKFQTERERERERESDRERENINGTDKRKKKLFVIDKAYKSCCFNNAEQLPVEYAMNKE